MDVIKTNELYAVIDELYGIAIISQYSYYQNCCYVVCSLSRKTLYSNVTKGGKCDVRGMCEELLMQRGG